MTKSVEKYLTRPIVKSISTIGLQDMTPPIFYVCQHDQLKADIVKKYGYDLEESIFFGMLNTSNETSLPTWMGTGSKEQFSKMLEAIYEYDYSELELLNGNKTDEKPAYMFSKDYCHEVIFDLNKFGEIKSKNKIHLIAMDPKRKNSLRIDYLPAAKQSVGPVGNENGDNLYEWARIQVKLNST